MDEKFDFKRFCDGVEGVLAVKEKLQNDPTCVQEWRNRLQMLKENPVRLVVMGECKRGKSSFINALLGVENLVPVGTDVATSTVFRIHYSKAVSYTVHFIEDAQKDSVAVSAEELWQFGTEDGNPRNEKGVAYIEVTCPSGMLENHVEIVDTPGLGGLCKNHKVITYQYLSLADAVFLVTDSEGSPVGQPELDLLKDLKSVTKNIYFVQTKSRLVEEEARLARRTNNIGILTRQAGFSEKELKYFVVDSKRKLEADESGDGKALARSGFAEVFSFMETTVGPNARLLSAERFMVLFSYEWLNVRNLLAEKKKYVNVTSTEELAAFVDDLKRAMAELQEWQTSVFPVRRHAFEEEIIDIETDISQAIAECGVNGAYGQSLRKRVYGEKKPKKLHDLVAPMQREIEEKFIKLNDGIRGELITRFNAALLQLLEGREEFVSPLNVCDAKTRASSEASESQDDRYQKYKGDGLLNRSATALMYGSFRGGMIGGAVGGAVGGVMGAIGGAVVGGPVGAVYLALQLGAAGAEVGGCLGVFDFTRRSWKASGAKDLAGAQQFYWQQISQDLLLNGNAIQTFYKKFARKAKNDLTFAVDQGTKNYKRHMEETILELKRKLVGKSRDNAAEKNKVAELEQMLEACSASINLG